MREIKLVQTEQEARLFEMGGFGFIAIHAANVNIDDLLNSHRPGAIVRCYSNPAEAIQFFPSGDCPLLGCVAGWISEDEQ